MPILRKYTFSSKSEADSAISTLGPKDKHFVIGHIVLTPEEYDENENLLVPQTLSSTYHVDVIWNETELSSWSNNIVWCPAVGVLEVGGTGIIQEWTEKCKELHPEYFTEV